MNEVDIGQQLMGEEPAGEEVAQQPEPQAQPEPQPEAQPQPQQPNFDPSLFLGALDNIHSRMDELQQPQRPQEPQQEPTEDERIIQELAEKMGLPNVQKENQTLKQQLEEMQGQSKQMQEFIQQQQIESTQQQILSKYDGISKDQVIGKLQELANQFGEEFATSLNNPKGWEYVISTQLQQPPSKPDPIVSTTSSGDDFLDSANERVRSGSAEQGDIGSLLLSNLGN